MKSVLLQSSMLAMMLFATMAHSKECQSLDLQQIILEPEFQAARAQAWIDSAEGSESEHEEGFTAYHCRAQKPGVCPEEYDYTTEIDRYPMGTRDAIEGTPDRTDPDCRLLLDFHTHPGVGEYSPFSNDEYANNFLSDSDIAFAKDRKVIAVVAWGRGSNPDNTDLVTYTPNELRPVNWQCSDAPPPTPACESEPPSPDNELSSGSSFGDPHLVTFDKYYYSFQAVGEFVLAQSNDGDIVVQSRQVPWSGSRTIALNSAVAMDINGDVVELYGLAFDTPTLMINKSIVLPESVETLPLTGGGEIKRTLNEYEFIWPGGSQVDAKVVSGILTLTVKVTGDYGDKMTGLLGNYDGLSGNDVVIRNESTPPDPLNYDVLYGAYADSWRVSEATSLFSYATGESTDTFTDMTFPDIIVRPDSFPQAEQDNAEQICRAAGVTDPLLLEACMIDILSTDESEFADAAADIQQTLDAPLVSSDLSVVQPAGSECPCAATFTANVMDIPPWEFSYLNLRTAPGAGCSLGNDQAFLDHESMGINGRAETQVCLASVGSTNLNNLDVDMTDEQYDACLDIIENNAKEWFSNGHSLEISANYQSPVPVSTLDEIACLR